MKPNRSTCFLSQERFDQIKSKYANFNTPWQETEVEELKALFADQLPVEEIATQLQRTPNSIKMKLKALGLLPSPPEPDPEPESEPGTEPEPDPASQEDSNA